MVIDYYWIISYSSTWLQSFNQLYYFESNIGDHCDTEIAIIFEYHSLIKYEKTEVHICRSRIKCEEVNMLTLN